MAAGNIFRQYLQTVIGLTIQADTVRNEGLDDMDSFIEFDEAGIKTLCNSVRKPGGRIPDPNYVAAIAGAPHPLVSNPGMHIPAICETKMILAAYTAHIYNMIGREIN